MNLKDGFMEVEILSSCSDRDVLYSFQNMYNIGGRMVNAYIIQSSILGCRMHPPGQVRSMCLILDSLLKTLVSLLILTVDKASLKAYQMQYMNQQAEAFLFMEL